MILYYHSFPPFVLSFFRNFIIYVLPTLSLPVRNMSTFPILSTYHFMELCHSLLLCWIEKPLSVSLFSLQYWRIEFQRYNLILVCFKWGLVRTFQFTSFVSAKNVLPCSFSFLAFHIVFLFCIAYLTFLFYDFMIISL